MTIQAPTKEECRLCKRCNTSKSRIEFKGSYCAPCRSDYMREYRNKNKLQISVYNQDYWRTNKEHLTEKQREFWRQNSERFLSRDRQYRKTNKEHIQARDRDYRERNKERRSAANKLWYKTHKNQVRETRKRYYSSNINARLAKALRNRLWDALKGRTKNGSAVGALGISLEEFRLYIEAKFYPGMTWDNWGIAGWHLDHIVPLSSFDLTNFEQMCRAMHFTNLQPLWALDNIRKGSSLEPKS